MKVIIEVLRMRVNVLMMILLAAVIKSLAHSHHGDNGCLFSRDDPSSLEDDSDYQLDSSGSEVYDIGGNLLDVLV